MKIIPETEFPKLLKEKKVSLIDYNKSSLPERKSEQKTIEDKQLEEIIKQTAALEKIAELIQKILISKEPEMLNLARVLEKSFKNLMAVLPSSKNSDRPRIVKLKIIRDFENKLDYVLPEYEEET